MISKQYSHNTNIQEGIRYDARNYGTVYTQQLDGDIRSRVRTYFGAKVSNRYRYSNQMDTYLVISWIKWNIKKDLIPPSLRFIAIYIPLPESGLNNLIQF